MELLNLTKILIFYLFLNRCQAGITGPSQREEMMMTDAEADQFEKFKAAVLPSVPNNWLKLDIGLMKYFTHAKKNADASIKNFKEGMKLRLDSDGYKLTDEIRDFGNLVFPRQEFFDKFGRKVAFFKAKRANVSLAMSNETLFKMSVQYLWSAFEENMERLAAKHATSKIFGQVRIIDVKDSDVGEVLSTRGIELLTKLIKETDLRFPRCTQAVLVLNAPTAYEMPLSLLKNVMSEYTRSIFFVYTEDDTIWTQQISQFMDIELLTDLYQKSKDVELAPPPPPPAADPPKGKEGGVSIPGADIGRKIVQFGSPFGGGGGADTAPQSKDPAKGSKNGKKTQKKKLKKAEEDDYDAPE